jgi:hypothetical protein
MSRQVGPHRRRLPADGRHGARHRRARLQGRGPRRGRERQSGAGAWAATNPQRRARVLMKFLDLIAKHNDELADILAREHGKTIADAKGDIQRGVEVVEFALGVPHLMKGEYTDGAGPGIDLYSMRQPLGVVAGITPFNFPAMIPLWKLAPAIACGNAFILKPSERDPGVPMRLASCSSRPAGLPAFSTSSTATRKRSTRSRRSRHPGDRLRRLDRRSPNTSIRAARRTASACSASAAPRTTWSSCPTPTWTRRSTR